MLCFQVPCMFFPEMKKPPNHPTCISKPRPNTPSIFLLISYVHFLEYLQWQRLQRCWVLRGKKGSPLGNQTHHQVHQQDISELQKFVIRAGKITGQVLNTHPSVAPLLPHTNNCLGCAHYT